VSAEAASSSVRLVSVLPPGAEAVGAFVFRFWNEPGTNDVFLSINNPFSQNVKYRAGMLLPGELRYRYTSSCPVLSGSENPDRGTLEHWPHPIEVLVLTEFRLVADGTKEATLCE
jgi:hypothetical protein